MSEGRPLDRSLKVKYLLACKSPDEIRKEKMKVWRKLRMTISLKQMSWLRAPRDLKTALERA